MRYKLFYYLFYLFKFSNIIFTNVSFKNIYCIQITSHHKIDEQYFVVKLYGITQDPETKNYMMVLEYAENGSLRNYLDKSYDKLVGV